VKYLSLPSEYRAKCFMHILTSCAFSSSVSKRTLFLCLISSSSSSSSSLSSFSFPFPFPSTGARRLTPTIDGAGLGARLGARLGSPLAPIAIAPAPGSASTEVSNPRGPGPSNDGSIGLLAAWEGPAGAACGCGKTAMGGYCGAGDAAATGVFRVIGCSSVRFFF
jgi:hypothetical protein